MRVFGGIAVLGAVTLFAWPWFRRLFPDLPMMAHTILLGIAGVTLGLILFFVASRTE